ncbi:autotransporter domain-containing protein [Budvicia diplopodorum]|uniref:autotransporter domain-containing protein n=1 Tax=Budvicia diplopodorum TaxID=1119056 RepID=UPI0013585BB8|nr:autotransporter domain-containing protein [Budvicia diplopodorum]
MLALRQSFDVSENQNLQLQYGIARIDGNGIDGKQKAGDNGLTGGYSQFFGLRHNLDLGIVTLNNSVRYDVQQLESSRSIRYSGVNQVAESDNQQQYLEWRSQFSKGFTLENGINLTPTAGFKLRQTNDAGYSERGAGDFNLQMDTRKETAVDAVVGLNLTYVGDNGWMMNALLEGGPNLSYKQSTQTASLQGAGEDRFAVASNEKGGDINSMAKVGLSYSQGASKLAIDAYNWKEDGITDKGMLMKYNYSF